MKFRHVVLICAMLFTTAAFAQTQAVQPVDPEACAPSERLQTGEGTAGTQLRPPATGSEKSQDLGNKLARTNGVLCPPAGIDPQISEPPPAGGKTPVIPPPGSPGGDQSVQPK
jgi:hypothetical protein